MEERMIARVSPAKVWETWEKAHAKNGQNSIVGGQKGMANANAKGKGFKYQILDVVPGERFSIVWKTLFVRLVFSHLVLPLDSSHQNQKFFTMSKLKDFLPGLYA